MSSNEICLEKGVWHFYCDGEIQTNFTVDDKVVFQEWWDENPDKNGTGLTGKLVVNFFCVKGCE